MSITEQLTVYRAKKAAEKKQQDNTSFFRRTLSVFKTKVEVENSTLEVEENKDTNPLIQQPEQPDPTTTPAASPLQGTRLTIHQAQKHKTFFSQFVNNDRFTLTIPRLLKLILWLILFGLFVELQFGSVFFIISLFYFVYTSMESGSRDKDRPSAYSVFNPNCERLDGTFTTEQFENELRYGAMHTN